MCPQDDDEKQRRDRPEDDVLEGRLNMPHELNTVVASKKTSESRKRGYRVGNADNRKRYGLQVPRKGKYGYRAFGEKRGKRHRDKKRNLPRGKRCGSGHRECKRLACVGSY